MAYIGWFGLRVEIRRLLSDRKALGVKIARGKEVRRRKVLPGGKVTVWMEHIPLDPEELAEARRHYAELSDWIAGFQEERRSCAYLAGDLIPAIDRANSGDDLGEYGVLDIRTGRR